MLGSIQPTFIKSSKVLNDDVEESILQDSSCYQAADQESYFGDDGDSEKNSLAMVPVKATDAGSSMKTLHDREVTALKPGWPLLHRKISSSERKVSERSLFRRISVVQWAMQLPSRNLSFDKDQFLGLDSKSGALVPVNADIGTIASPERKSMSFPKELEGLHEKYSSTCRLFNYQELVSATSNFLPGEYFEFFTMGFICPKVVFIYDMVYLAM